MPMYEAACPQGHEKTIYLSAFDAPMPPCEQCGEPLARRVSAPGAFVFDGRGTYDKGFVSKRAPK